MSSMWERGDGWRHGFLGLPGVGKSYATIATIDYALDAGAADVALILDDKGRVAQYRGTYRVNPDQLRRFPPTGDETSRRIVFRGIAARCVLPGTRQIVECAAEDVADEAWRLALITPEAPRVLLVLDELLRAVRPNSVVWQGDQLRRAFADGRGVGLSCLWTTQLLAKCPTEVTDLGTVGMFRLAGRSLAYVAETLKIRDLEMLQVIERLPEGVFVLWDPMTGWDGRTWRFPSHTL